MSGCSRCGADLAEVPATRVVQARAGEARGPVREQLDQAAGGEVARDLLALAGRLAVLEAQKEVALAADVGA